MRQSAKRFTSFILSLFMLGGAVVVYFNFISPAYDELQLLRADEAARSQFVENEQAAVQKVQDLISTYQGQAGLQDTISQALPQGADASGALLQLSGIAQATGLAPQQFTVTQTLAAPAPSSNGAPLGDSTEPFSKLTTPMGTLLIHVQLVGSYENFKNFVKDVESNIRIMNVQNLLVHPSQPQQSSVGGTAGAKVVPPPPDIFSYDVTVAAYYQTQPQQQQSTQ